MDVMDVLLVLVVLVLVVLVIAAPLRRARPAADEEVATEPRRADLEAAKEAKYREIRDAELDYRTGKLAQEDWERLDATLRADALELLRRIESVGNGAAGPG